VGAAAALFLMTGWVKRNGEEHRLAAELATQVREREECRSRLGVFYRAWLRYRAEHHGVEPGSLDDLVPGYLPDPHLLVCPTGQRLLEQGRPVERGSYRRARRLYPTTYGFAFLSASNAVQVHWLGARAPLVVCYTHREAAFRAVYGRAPPLGAFDPTLNGKWLKGVANTPLLTVRRDGQLVDLLSLD
jgi:hypothetical protein